MLMGLCKQFTLYWPSALPQGELFFQEDYFCSTAYCLHQNVDEKFAICVPTSNLIPYFEPVCALCLQASSHWTAGRPFDKSLSQIPEQVTVLPENVGQSKAVHGLSDIKTWFGLSLHELGLLCLDSSTCPHTSLRPTWDWFWLSTLRSPRNSMPWLWLIIYYSGKRAICMRKWFNWRKARIQYSISLKFISWMDEFGLLIHCN